ncbi:MAG: alpha/beta hydrolase [Rhodospirillaceae bacterium]
MVVKEHRGYVDGKYGLMHYRQYGEGPPLLLIHQTPWSSQQYKNAAPFLAGNRQVIALDSPGYGESDAPPDAPSIPDYADSIPGFLDGLEIDQADVLGHHTGALIAGAFAARHPTRLNRLILHGAPVYDENERVARLSNKHFDQSPKEDGSHYLDYWALLRRVIGPNAKLSGLHMGVLSFFTNGEKEWYGHTAAFTYDFAADIPSITCPTLIVSNTADMLAAHAERLRGLRPDFAYAEISGGSSNIIFDEPKRWADPITAWLNT